MTRTFHAGALVAGATDVSVLLVLPVSTVFNAAGLVVSYTRAGAAPVTGTPVSITPTGAHTDWGLVPVDATNLPELHRLDLPDAAVATGATSLTVSVSSTAMAAQHATFTLQGATRRHGQLASGTHTVANVATGWTLGANQLARRLLEFTTGACAGQRVAIVGNTVTGQLELAPPLTTAPTTGDWFVVF